MTNEMKIYRILSGILIAALGLYIGKAFWTYFIYSFGTIVGVWFTAVTIGYLYIVIGIARFEKRAWIMFLTIILLAIFVAIPFIVIGKVGNKTDIIEWLFTMVFWVSLVAIPVFGISALIRKIRKDKNNK